MKVLVTGVAGQLGHDVMNELSRRGYEGVGSDLAASYAGIDEGSPVAKMPYVSLDITDSKQVSRTINDLEPDVVVHCAAWTAVDAAEEEENRTKVEAVNVIGTENIAKACAETGAKMVYLSTDYVFDGQGTTPWQPDQQDFKPLNVYGQTKLAGEEAVRKYLTKYFIVRIAWVFGINGHNFIKTMLKVGKTHDEVRVVNDQIGTPTYTYDLARLLVDMIETDRYGTYHATNSELSQDNGFGTKTGYISWYDFTKEIYRQAGYTTKVTPVTTEEYGMSKAKRPFNSRLDKSKLAANGFKPLPDWTDALSRYLKILKDCQE
jgi:dTDP-4-dehydrorhamnose reductase